ncbi:glycoside hydrolase family 2 TIM barrel-domain containing protein [Mucilaginibacter sp.]|uniref:glycoside hydrolase family 2 TIM barrel-domain containing protein n=1 Tax=Mucilaginibacter sp. TaxID=1882438 RepID=UPI0026083339|nr:glycoside hydrolase family 2 TIM barrel-domain containing protein [Mucilaginibacter sp.]MDB4923070.1 beta-galactosidase [Mucilaginibacter sp.]
MKKIIFNIWILLCATQLQAQRINTTINSGWKFHHGDVSAAVTPQELQSWQTINLPHTWNDKDAFDEERGYYRGIGWYAKVISIPLQWKGKSIYIHFEGANQETNVYLNGRHLGVHKGGYTAFNFDLSDQLNYGQQNLITVKVDNKHDENIPPLNADFTFYGGIYRNVRLIVAEPVHFDIADMASDGVTVETPLVSDQKAVIKLVGKVVNNTTASKEVTIQAIIFDKDQQAVVSKTSSLVIPSHTVADFKQDKIEITKPKLWSPDDPYLYHAVIRVIENGAVSDELSLPVGLRWYAFSGQGGFMLNGKAFKLIGTNRHQDFSGKGNALTDDYHRNDYTKIKSLGFNFMRLAHYPQAPEVYRTCDELGILVWSEIPIVNEITQTEEFTSNCLNMQREQIRQTRNHPCVILYGYMNEIYIKMLSDKKLSEEKRKQVADATIELAKKLNALTKSESSRPTVMAQHFEQGYNTYGISDIPDVVGWNLYFGWYYDKLEDLSKFLNREHMRYPNRPMIVSEFGADADIRNHALVPLPQDFSEEYEQVLHASYLKQMLAMPFLSGFAAWNFADFGAENRANATPFINQKGLVSYDRTEKAVCDLYRAYFSKEPVLSIATRNNLQRTGVENADGQGKSTQPVTVYTNLNPTIFKLNGRVIGLKQAKDKQVVFDVPFVQGSNLLEATDGKGHTDRATVHFEVIPVKLNSKMFNDLAVNVGSFQSFFEPNTHVLWIPDQPYKNGGWGYIGGAPYTKIDRQLKVGVSGNILGTTSNPLFQTFNEGIGAYRFDVPNGSYTITLCFMEYNTKMQANDSLYTFSGAAEQTGRGDTRQFNVAINGLNVIDGLNLAHDYGSLRAVTFEVKTAARDNNGIEVKFSPVRGKAILSGIRVTRN